MRLAFFPVNRDVFGEDVFRASSVTDTPMVTEGRDMNGQVDLELEVTSDSEAGNESSNNTKEHHGLVTVQTDIHTDPQQPVDLNQGSHVGPYEISSIPKAPAKSRARRTLGVQYVSQAANTRLS